MWLDTFFAEYPVFRHEELVAYVKQHGDYNLNSLKASLQYHLAKEHIVRIRRGYYAVKTQGAIVDDSILIAGRIAPDAIIAYHSALSFHALAYSMYVLSYCFSHAPVQPFQFLQSRYQCISHPRPLQPNQIALETKSYDRQGLDIRVTTVERTLVDCLDKPKFAGGWEEIWRAGDMINILDVERMINYVLCLGNATTVAKVGFFLEQFQRQFNVKEEHLKLLEEHKPKSKHYMGQRGEKDCRYFQRWNLMVPLMIVNKTWEEPNDDFV